MAYLHKLYNSICAFAVVTAAAASAGGSELFQQGAGEKILFSGDEATISALQSSGIVRVPGFPLNAAEEVTLEVTRFSPLSPDALVRIGFREPQPLKMPDGLTLYRGRIVGDPNSVVFMSLYEHTLRGYVLARDMLYTFESSSSVDAIGRPAAPSVNPVADMQQTPAEECYSDSEDGSVPPLGPPILSQAARPSRLRSKIAVEVSQDLSDLFSLYGEFKTAIITIWAQQRLGALSALYAGTADIDFQLVFLQIWSSEDPQPVYYVTSGIPGFGVRRCRIQRYWETCLPPQIPPRPLVLQDPRETYGCGSLEINPAPPCETTPILVPRSHVYSLWQSDSGALGEGWTFNPVCTPGEYAWSKVRDVADLLDERMAHEVGHTFASPHSECYQPPIDKCSGPSQRFDIFGECYSGPFEQAPSPTIMSRCTPRAQPLHFHAREAFQIRRTAESGMCLDQPSCSSPFEVDSDGDGWVDFCDDCPAEADPTQSACPVDCNCDDTVSIDELISGVGIVLGNKPVGQCLAADANEDFLVTINEIIAGLQARAVGCGGTGGPGSTGGSVIVDIGAGQNVPGSTVTIPLALTSAGQARAIQIDVALDDATFVSPDPATACTLSAALSTTHQLSVSLPFSPLAPPGHRRLRIAVFPQYDTPMTILPGGELLSCTLQIQLTASLGTHSIDGDQLLASNDFGTPLPASVDNGSVFVCGGCGCS
jgi:hypothetical protein